MVLTVQELMHACVESGLCWQCVAMVLTVVGMKHTSVALCSRSFAQNIGENWYLIVKITIHIPGNFQDAVVHAAVHPFDPPYLRCNKRFVMNKMSLGNVVYHLRSKHMIYADQGELDGVAK